MHWKLTGAIAAAVLVAPFLPWQAPAAQEAEEESVLHGRMEDLNATLRQVQRLIKEPEQIAQAVDLVVAMERNVLEAKAEIPPRADTLEGAARDEFVLGFRRDMIKLLVTLTELELACLEGKTDGAQEVFKRLVEHRDASHELYQEE